MSSLQSTNFSQSTPPSSSYQENVSSNITKHSQKQEQHKKESTIDLTWKFKQSIEKKDISIAKQIVEQESVSKKTLLIWLSIVLQMYSQEMVNIVKLLIKKGADVDDLFRPLSNQISKVDNKDKLTIIMFICQKGDNDLLDVVLEYSNNINILDKNDKSALIYAILSGKGDDAISIIVKKLIDKGANMNINFKIDMGRKVITTHSPLSLSVELNLTQTALVLLNNKADPNFKTSPDKQTALHIAAKNSNLDIVNALLNCKGVLLEEKNDKEQTPGHLAATLPKTEIYKNIIAKIEENKKNNINNNEDNATSTNNNGDDNTSITTTTITSNVYSNDNNVEINTVNHNNNHNNDESLVAQKNIHFPLQQHSSVQKKITSLSKQYKDIKLKYQNKKSTSTFKIPFNFIKANKQQTNSSLYLSSYINFTNTKEPELIIDLSSDQIDLEQKHTQTLNEKNNAITNLESENNALKQEIEKYRSLNLKHRQKEEEDQLKIVNLNEQLKYLTKQNEELQKTVSHLEKENKELHFKLSQESQPILNNQTAMSQYLNKKYIHFTYDPTYLFNCLSKDIIEYQRYVFERLQNEQHHYTMLIQNLQNTVNECLKEYDVHLYGSHATGLCLPWSDLDVVLIPRTPKIGQNVSINNPKLLKQLFEFLRQQPWVKDAKFIASASMPIIKLISVPQYNSIPIDISIQDERHFGLQCVDLVKNFISQYESLKPLVLALKNILKQANLNDPYKGGISSYGLILMIVSFLQTQKRSGLDISVNQNNLGKLFFDCVNYYGLQFDPAKFIIYARKTEDDENDEINLQVSIYLHIHIYIYYRLVKKL